MANGQTTTPTQGEQAFFDKFGRMPTVADVSEFMQVSAELVNKNLPSEFNATDTQPQPEVKLPEVQPDTTPVPTGQALSEQIRQQTEQLFKPSQQQQQLEAERGSLRGDLIEAVRDLGGQEAEQQRLSQQEGVTQLTEQLTGIAGQIEALGLQSQAQQIQIAGQEAGVPKTIVQGQLTRAQRDKAVQSLQLAAQASVLQGNLSLAQQRVQQALDVKYEPLKQQIQMLQLGLEFNKEDLSRADQKRAEELQFQLAERERAIARAEKQDQQISDIALQMAQAGASSEITNQIFRAKSLEEATGLVGDFVASIPGERKTLSVSEGQTIIDQDGNVIFDKPKKSELDQLLSVTDAKALGVPFGTTKGEAYGLRVAEATVGTLSEEQTDLLFKLRKEASSDPDISGYIDIRDAYDKVEAAAAQPSAAGDLSLIFSFMKMLDPGSVVREGEFANAQNAGGIPDRIRAQYNKIVSGERLTETQREDFVNQARNVYQPKLQNYLQAVEFYQDEAASFGVPSDRVIRSYLTPGADVSSKEIQVKLPPLNQSYSSLGDLVRNRPDYEDVVIRLQESFPRAEESELLQILEQESFTQPVQVSSVVGKLSNGKTQLSMLGSGTITGIDGSSAWAPGLDFVLDGGKGADVPSPVLGKVKFAGKNGGFGNQVKVRLQDGSEMWISHLDNINVSVGETIRPGQILGKQGNTGTVLGSAGEGLTASQIASGRGTHLDITIKKPDGGYFTAREVAALLGDTRINKIA